MRLTAIKYNSIDEKQLVTQQHMTSNTGVGNLFSWESHVSHVSFVFWIAFPWELYNWRLVPHGSSKLSDLVDVKVSHQQLSRQVVHQTKVLTKLFKNTENFYSLPYDYGHTTHNTFQENACFTIFGQSHIGGSKKTNVNPNPDCSKNPNPSSNSKPNPLKTPTWSMLS